MKTILNKTFALLAILSLYTISSCTSEKNGEEGSTMIKFQEMSNDEHVVEIYTHHGSFEQGFNEVELKIKNKSNNQYITNAELSWMPMMHMMGMMHSCPKSEIEKKPNSNSIYEGYLVFQMAQNEMEFWDLTINYTVNGLSYSVSEVIDVPASENRNIEVFTGTDNIKYIIAYAEPHHPKVGLNDLEVGVWKMESMESFPVVNDFTVSIDPRMPSMGNHGSPNNVDATQMATGDLYEGIMSLTMTGYWRINLQLNNQNGEVVKGEKIEEGVTESSIYFEVEL